MIRITSPALAGAALALAALSTSFLAAQPEAAAQTACVTPAVPGVSAQGQVCIAPQIPYDVNLSKAATTSEKKLAYDVWSWNAFIALNWPVSGQRGEPDTAKTLAGTGARVWESYKTTPETFPTPPAKPTAWNTPVDVVPPANCPAPPTGWQASGWLNVLSRANKGDDPALSAVVQPMSGKFGHLIDQNRNYVYIDVMTNRQSYEFVVDNGFYDADKQAAASQQQLLFPSGDIATAKPAPINVKPAWKILAGADEPSRFYSRPAYVIEPGTGKCTVQTVGLVGFHLTAKTTAAPQWIWATFEHKDNAPDCSYPNGEAKGCTPAVTAGAHYSFFNSSCTTCKLNELPTSQTDRTPVQVARIVPIPDDVKAINQQVAGLLKGTVWANYVLVDTQFPLQPATLYGNPLPTRLANTVLETYNQGVSPLTQTSACLGCHFPASAAGVPPGTLFTDFDWQMHKAKSYSKP